MNTQNLSSINSSSAQADFVPSSNGHGHLKGDSPSNGRRRPSLVHLVRRMHATICGKDRWFYSELTVTTKITETTCRHCLAVHERARLVRRQARAWKNEHASRLNVVKQPANLEPDGFVQLEMAFQKALAVAEAAELQQAARQHHAVTERHV
jgi:hypothetical protein